MNIRIFSALAGACMALLTAPLQAQSYTLKEAADGDLQAQKLSVAPAMTLANESRDAVSFSWDVAAGETLAAQPLVFEARSHEFSVEVSGVELNRGVSIVTDGVGAVVRISSIGKNSTQLDMRDITLGGAGGQRYAGGAGIDQLVNGDDLRAAGLPVGGRMLGFRLRESLGAGGLTLSSGAAHAADERFLLSVLDRNGTTELNLATGSDSYLAANEVRATASLTTGRAKSSVERASAWLVSPDGTRLPAGVARSGSEIAASARLPADAARSDGLWELHVSAVGQNGVRRDVKTAFAVATPAAGFDGSVTLARTAAGLHFDLGARVASAGRYEARAVLFGTTSAGEARPVQVAATADWLEAGSATLGLRFDAEALKRTGVSAPFELRHLALLDQSRMAVLERRQLALSVAD